MKLLKICSFIDLRTSHPDFRVNMVVVYKKFFFRLRSVFENELIYEKDKNKIENPKDAKKKLKKNCKIEKLKVFLVDLFRIMNLYLYPGISLLFYLFFSTFKIRWSF